MLALVKGGIPYDVAFELDDDWRRAFCVIFGELDGGTFNWGSMQFEEPSSS